MPITLDYTNLMAENIGDEFGIHCGELAALREPVRTIHAGIVNRRQHGELPFYDLPQQHQSLNKILELAGELRERFDTIVVLGIGGSALGTSSLFRALRPLGHNL
ncbi:MAG: glucose-6-phosphate isomerase, partial [Desulfuromonas sp.]